jgi:hypothetical protein
MAAGFITLHVYRVGGTECSLAAISTLQCVRIRQSAQSLHHVEVTEHYTHAATNVQREIRPKENILLQDTKSTAFKRPYF